LKSAMSVVQIPGLELLRRPISKSQGGSWQKCSEVSLGTRSVWDWEGPPRLDSWGLAFCSWARLIAKEFVQHHLAYHVASSGAPGKLSPPEVSIDKVQIGRIEPKCESRQVKLWRRSPSSLSMCLALGRARGICRLPTGIVEIPPYCWFAALSEAEHALGFAGSGIYFSAAVTWHNAPTGPSNPANTDGDPRSVSEGTGSTDRTACAHSAVAQGRRPRITAAALAAAPPGEQKMMLRGPLREAVGKYCPALATKVTDGLLSRDNPEILEMLECDIALRQGIYSFLRSSEGWNKDRATRGGSAARDDPQPTTPPRTTAC